MSNPWQAAGVRVKQRRSCVFRHAAGSHFLGTRDKKSIGERGRSLTLKQ